MHSAYFNPRKKDAISASACRYFTTSNMLCTDTLPKCKAGAQSTHSSRLLLLLFCCLVYQCLWKASVIFYRLMYLTSSSSTSPICCISCCFFMRIGNSQFCWRRGHHYAADIYLIKSTLIIREKYSCNHVAYLLSSMHKITVIVSCFQEECREEVRR